MIDVVTVLLALQTALVAAIAAGLAHWRVTTSARWQRHQRRQRRGRRT